MGKTRVYGKRKFSIDKLLSVVNIIALCLIGFTMIYPFWEILVKSFNLLSFHTKRAAALSERPPSWQGR